MSLQERIDALRLQVTTTASLPLSDIVLPMSRVSDIAASSSAASFDNISVERTNAMKFFPNYFKRGQVFMCYYLVRVSFMLLLNSGV